MYCADMTNEQFASLLTEAQNKKYPGLPDAAVAKQIGVSRQLFWAYKNGKAFPTMEKLTLLVQSLELKPEDIFQSV